LRIILLGAPGVGKGTQAKLISEYFNISHISTGDLFRLNIKDNTLLGLQAKEYIEKGQLVPDSITISMVSDRISKEDCKGGFLLDGFPRNLNQAKELEGMLVKSRQYIDKVISIDIPEDIIVERIVGRRFCPKCGSSYHIRLNPSKAHDRCEKCHEALTQREDDKEEIIKDRLAVYYKSTKPLINYYSDLGLLCKIKGDADIKEVFTNIYSTLQAI
jgi:adenylate kinase